MTEPTRSTGPLAGVRIIDLTTVILGPYATQTLADMGADVIKIETPDGDISRQAGTGRSPAMGPLFLNTNRNKRSVVLNLKEPAAYDALLRLVANADVFVHSMRPQAMRKLRLTYDDLRKVKPDLIHCSLWGFGTRGPYAERPAYDDVIQGLSGIADLSARRSGGPPELAPAIIADKTTGLMAVGAITAALYHHAKTGVGQSVEVPMLETMVSYNLIEHLFGAVFEPQSGSMGYSRALAGHRKPHRTADGYMVLLPYTSRQWKSFLKAADLEHRLTEPWTESANLRSKMADELYGMIGEVMPRYTTEKWARILEDADVPSVPVATLESLLVDPHLAATEFFPTFDHPTEGRLRTTNVPWNMTETPGQVARRGAPRLGGDTRAVLQEAGLSPDEIAALLKSGAAQADET